MIPHVRLLSLSHSTFDKLRRGKYWRYHLPSDEWDDMRAAAALRVFTKRGLYRKRKGAIEPWVYRVVDNAIKNGLRSYLGWPRSICLDQRRAMLRHAPLSAAADVVDVHESVHPSFYIDDVVGECMTDLKPTERRVFSRILCGDTGKALERNCRMGYQAVLSRRHRIRSRFTSLLRQ